MADFQDMQRETEESDFHAREAQGFMEQVGTQDFFDRNIAFSIMHVGLAIVSAINAAAMRIEIEIRETSRQG